MRKRAIERQRLSRRRISGWIWFLFILFAVTGLLLVALRRYQLEKWEHSPPDVNASKTTTLHQDFNLTEELLSSTSFTRQLVDQITLAKAFLVISKEQHNFKFAWDLSTQIRNSQRLLSRAAVEGRPISQNEAQPMIHLLSQLIYKAQDMHYDLATTITTLKAHSQALEHRVDAAIVQTAAFGRLAAYALPKYVHCVAVKLTELWFINPTLQKLEKEQSNSPRLTDNSLYHFCLFSDNVLAAAAVVNSTIFNADHPQQIVFHIITDPVNWRAMKAWFMGSSLRGAMVEVLSTGELVLDHQKSLKPVQHCDTEPVLDHLRFYIPEIFPSLEKIVFLEDDVVVQKDLTALFSLELHGHVNGAVETCFETFHRYHQYLNFSSPLISSKFDPETCGWAFGVNVFDLVLWRKANLTAKYKYWLGQNEDHTLWTGGILPLGLLTFYGSTETLDRRWHVLGLGFDPDIDDRLIESAAVIHFNGNMKPWLGSAITRYRALWVQYVNRTRLGSHGCSPNW
ncbi:hexosyltransferase GAUT11-like [Wolffia australiana]